MKRSLALPSFGDHRSIFSGITGQKRVLNRRSCCLTDKLAEIRQINWRALFAEDSRMGSLILTRCHITCRDSNVYVRDRI
jgi:hypothetical protein